MDFPELFENPALSHRFSVVFMGGLLSKVLDFRFQKVSGLSTEVQTETLNEGGENLFARRLPTKINYNNLVLERGYVVGSALNVELNVTFSNFQFYPSDVLVMLLHEDGYPIGAWNCLNAYPVRWSVSDLDGQSNTVLVDTIELAYTRFQILRI